MINKKNMKYKIVVFIFFLLLGIEYNIALAESSLYKIFKKANNLYKKGDLIDSMVEYEKLLKYKEFVGRKELFLKLGEIYLKKGKIEKLLKLSNNATEEFPEFDYSHAGLAAAWGLKAQKSTNYIYKLKQATIALNEADKAIRINRTCALALFVKGMIYFYYPRILGKLDESIIYFRDVLTSLDFRKTGFLEDTYYYLALALRRKRKTEEAIIVLKKGMTLFPDSYIMRNLLYKYKKKKR